MKKLNFHTLYLLSFLFFDTSFCFSLTNNRLVKTVREHKKKVATFTFVAGYIAMIYLVDKKFEAVYQAYKNIPNKEECSEEIEQITNRLACLANTWFSLRYQKTFVAIAITNYPQLFPKWETNYGSMEIDGTDLYIYRKK